MSAPHDEVLLFRQKDPKPGAPGRGLPEGAQPRPEALGQLQRITTLDPRLKTSRMTEKKAKMTTLSVIPDPRLRTSRTGPDRGSRVWRGRYLERRGTTPFGSAQGRLQVVPYGIMVFARKGGPGCPPFLFLGQFLQYVAAHAVHGVSCEAGQFGVGRFESMDLREIF